VVITAVLLAGDSGAIKNVLGQNKAFLYINDKLILFYVLKALDEAKQIDKIFLVGPKTRIEKHINKWDVKTSLTVIDQKSNVYENTMSAFLQSLPGYSDQKSEEELEKVHPDQPILIVAADIPILVGAEIDHFITHADLQNYDTILGITTESVMKKFYPTDTTPGIQMTCFHMKEFLFRQSNIMLLKPFQLKNRKYLQLMYDMRYQKKISLALKLAWTLLKLTKGSLAILYDFFALHLNMRLTGVIPASLMRLTRGMTNRSRLCRNISMLLDTRFCVLENPLGGAALDTDNEQDYRAMQEMFDTWKKEQQQLGEDIS
jgi:GTP:adenosylcobinamide-phosphate guanylyltransferase